MKINSIIKKLKKTLFFSQKVNFSKVHPQQIFSKLNEFADENSIKNEKLELIYHSFLQTHEFKNKFQDLMKNQNSKVKILLFFYSVRENLHQTETTTNVFILDQFTQKIFEHQKDFNIFELLMICEAFAKFKVKNSNLIQLMEDQLTTSRVDILSLRQNAFEITKRILKFLIDSNELRSEFIYELMTINRLLFRENVIKLKDLAKFVRLLIKTGGCYGVSGIIDSNFLPKKCDFSELVQISHTLVPLNILSKEKVDQIQTEIVRYLRYFLKEEIDLSLLNKNGIENKIKLPTHEIIKIFETFGSSKIENESLRDKMIDIVLDYIENISNFHFIKVVQTFCKGHYNFSSYKELYNKIEEQSAVRLGGLSTNDIIDLFHSIATYGKMSVPLLKKFIDKLNQQSMSGMTVAYMSRLFKAITFTKSYFLPKSMIDDSVWKKMSDNIYISVQDLHRKLMIESFLPYYQSFAIAPFNLFLLPKLFITVLEANDFLECQHFNTEFSNLHKIIEYHGHEYIDFLNKGQYLLNSSISNIIQKNDNPMNSIHVKKITIDDLSDMVFELVHRDVFFENNKELIGYLTFKHQFLSKESLVKILRASVCVEDVSKIKLYLNVIQDLQTYGEIKHFFSQKQYIELCWSVFAFVLKQINLHETFSNKLRKGSFAGDEDFFIISDSNKHFLRVSIAKYLNSTISEILKDFLSVNINLLDAETFELYRNVVTILIVLNKFVG